MGERGDWDEDGDWEWWGRMALRRMPPRGLSERKAGFVGLSMEYVVADMGESEEEDGREEGGKS